MTTSTDTMDAVLERLASLHNADTAILVPNVTAAARATLEALTNPGGRVIASRDVSGTTRTYLEEDLPRLGRAVDFVDCSDADAVADAILPETQVIYSESVSAPLGRLCPVNDLSTLAHSADLIVVVDNSGLSPILHRPVDSGAAVVIEDCATHLDEHDGAGLGLVASAERFLPAITRRVHELGGPASSLSAEPLARSLDGLASRVKVRNQKAEEIAKALREMTGVSQVHRPRFEDHPWVWETHEGFGAGVGLELAAGSASVRALVDALHSEGLAVSGDDPLRTRAEVPALDTHSRWTEWDRLAVGVTRATVQLTAGSQDPEPLITRLAKELG